MRSYRRRRRNRRPLWVIISGIALMLLGLSVTVFLARDFNYWHWMPGFPFFVSFMGYFILVNPLYERLENSKPRFFINDPGKWLKYFALELLLFLVGITAIVKLDDGARAVNRLLHEWLLTKNTVVTEGLLVGKTTLVKQLKTSKRKETFCVILYPVEGVTRRQGVSTEKHYQEGATYQVTYSKSCPSVIKVGLRTFNERKNNPGK